MNLLARFLSHGFAFVVVALILLVFIYRGEIFEDWDLPDFLVVKGKAVSSEQTSAGAVDRTDPEKVTDEDVTGSAPAAVSVDAASPAAGSGDASDDKDTSAAEVSDYTDVVDTGSQDQETASSEAGEPQAGTDEPEGNLPVPAEAKPSEAEPAEAEPAEAEPAEAEPASEPAAADDVTPDSLGAADESGTEQVVTPPSSLAEDGSTVKETAAADDMVTAENTAPVKNDMSATEAPSAAQLPVAEPSESDAAASPTRPPATDASSDNESAYSIMAAAREAYWLRDFDTAEQGYKALIKLEPDNPDGYGELGNMYFSQGKWDEAASAYYEAGLRLLKDGMVVQARQMVEVIRGLNGTQADELDAEISTSQQ